MKTYKYKMKWIFNIDFKHKEVFTIIKTLGARSFDSINFLTSDLKRVDHYDGFISFPFGLADIETIKAIKKYLKKTYSIGGKDNVKISYIELTRN